MQQINLKIKGLYTYPNNLGRSLPEGALSKATNIVIDADDIAQSRRGFDRLTYGLPSSLNRFSKLFTYQSKILASVSDNTMAWYDSSLGWQTYSGTFTPIALLHPIRSAQSNQNFYFTTATGVKKLAAYNGSVGSAGMVKALDLTAALAGAGSGFFSPDNQIAYRVVWGIKDANNNVILGAPSQRAVIANPTAGTADVVDLTITIPAGITTSHFYQVYRSSQSGSDDIEPNDELQLVYEANPTSGEITAGSISVTDETPDSLRGATIYTAPSQQGIEQANEVPPLAKDIAFFKDSVFYANTVSKQRLIFSILATGGTSGIAVNDTITIAGTTYTAKAAENAAAGEFKVFTGSTPAQDVADTAQSLVRVVNKYASNTTVYAYYISNYDDLPGKVLIEERGVGGSSFAATVSAHSEAYSPQLPTSGTSVSSSNDAFAHAVYFSKEGEPEAVPLLNIFKVGNAAAAILRLVPLRDSLFVLKEDGIFRILGNSASDFRLEIIDTSTKVIAPETAVELNNQIYALSDQGVVLITETGVSTISRAIEGTINELFGANLDAVAQYSFGISYETDRKYILFTISQAADTYSTQAFVYNIFTNTWTRWDLAKRCGLVDSTQNKIVLGDATTHYANLERKTFTFRDYVDQMDSVSITAFSGHTLTLSSVSGIEVGDLIYQSNTVNSVVTAVSSGASQVTVRDALSNWTVGSATHYSAIETITEWVPATGGNPGVIKSFQDPSVFFRDVGFTSIDLGFKTEVSPNFEYVTISGQGVGAWGLFGWGAEPWGGASFEAPVRTFVPLEKSRATTLIVQLKTRLAFQRFATQGLSIPFISGNTWTTA